MGSFIPRILPWAYQARMDAGTYNSHKQKRCYGDSFLGSLHGQCSKFFN